MNLIEPQPGATIGSWRIRHCIGRGGMSEVFAVAHVASQRPGALKIPHAEAMARPRAADRFVLEGRILRDVRHPGVPLIFELGTYTDGRPYLVMEQLHGVTLAELVEAHPPPLDVTFKILEQLGSVLAAAHGRGVLHRDLKPDNIILLDGDELVVKLVDWGIAKRLDAAPDTALTCTGAIVGTPRYLSPEQVRAEPVDARTDIYALGLVAYELLLGVHPFETSSLGDALFMQMAKEPPSPRRHWPEIPAELERVLLGMLAKDPRRRPTLAAVLDAIRVAQQAGPTRPLPERMRTGEFDLAATSADVPSSQRATSRWRPLKR